MTRQSGEGDLSGRMAEQLDFESLLAATLLSQHFCDSVDESQAMAEAICSEHSTTNDRNLTFLLEKVLQSLIEYFDCSTEQARKAIGELEVALGLNDEDMTESSDDADKEEPSEFNLTLDENDSDDKELLKDGECELCDRYIKLTRHHLLPKSTWNRLLPKLQHAAAAKESGDEFKAKAILGHGLEHIYNELSTDKVVIHRILHSTCDICRACHSTIHSTHDNLTLAMEYGTIELLLQDERITKFCKWASKQKPGKHSIRSQY